MWSKLPVGRRRSCAIVRQKPSLLAPPARLSHDHTGSAKERLSKSGSEVPGKIPKRAQAEYNASKKAAAKRGCRRTGRRGCNPRSARSQESQRGRRREEKVAFQRGRAKPFDGVCLQSPLDLSQQEADAPPPVFRCVPRTAKNRARRGQGHGEKAACVSGRRVPFLPLTSTGFFRLEIARRAPRDNPARVGRI